MTDPTKFNADSFIGLVPLPLQAIYETDFDGHGDPDSPATTAASLAPFDQPDQPLARSMGPRGAQGFIMAVSGGLVGMVSGVQMMREDRESR